MTIAQQIGKVHVAAEQRDKVNDFIKSIQILAAHRKHGTAVQEAEKLKASPRVAEYVKAAINPNRPRLDERNIHTAVETTKAAAAAGNTTDSIWAEPLTQQNLASAFLASLSPMSLWDLLFPQFVQAPLMTSIASVTTGFTGAQINEGHVKSFGNLSIAAADLLPTKIVALLDVTDELLKFGDPLATSLLRGELQKAVTKATNAWLTSQLFGSATSVASSTFTALGVRQDIRTLLSLVNSQADGRLVLVTTRAIVEALSILQSSTGEAAFTTVNANGNSTIGGIPIYACDEVTSGEMYLVDCSQVAAGQQGTLTLDSSNEAMIQLDTTADSPPGASTAYISPWQMNHTILRAERWIGVKLIRSNAVAKITGINYTGASPA